MFAPGEISFEGAGGLTGIFIPDSRPSKNVLRIVQLTVLAGFALFPAVPGAQISNGSPANLCEIDQQNNCLDAYFPN
jgi:hypothetical protein